MAVQLHLWKLKNHRNKLWVLPVEKYSKIKGNQREQVELRQATKWPRYRSLKRMSCWKIRSSHCSSRMESSTGQLLWKNSRVTPTNTLNYSSTSSMSRIFRAWKYLIWMSLLRIFITTGRRLLWEWSWTCRKQIRHGYLKRLWIPRSCRSQTISQ